ncbi:DivIVA domain-containing protein [Deinococcus wulumuqiensis]|uniref:Minicell-associated protein DivIVA n=1 Tax=Deinococcus wulumuqiensis TaxID=980427 RepID=A0AAV4K7H8_9DEIO|nr:DivIVA domain-containing protein [Deinococcus wulumuqiensis]QII20135.1 DivIVA domain-containing protein [Deinococcus wulumuqiensis R12]GGI75875.1 minicell-associated protein DivIVA [Deinococcus wulumuqiensis]GGP28771.1 minicell-associated protein DivIVA [Deinococcus wulumuqiensis]
MSPVPPLSPRDITHQSFDGRVSGYDKAQVRAYLSDVARSLESLLQENRQQRERLAELQTELEEKKRAEDEIRRAIVSAERLAHEVRENAAREVALLLEQAHAKVAEVQTEHTRRVSEDERRHEQRLAELDTAFRNRYAELERDHHDWLRTREREQADRLAELERQFHAQHQDLSGRLGAARQEYAQFLSAYRALLASFGELSLRHALPEETPLALTPLSVSPLSAPPLSAPPLAVTGGGAPGPARVTPDVVSALSEVPPELAAALLGAEATPVNGMPGLADGLPRPLALNSVDVLQGLPDAVPVYAGETAAGETGPETKSRLGRHGESRSDLDAEHG